MKFLYPVPLNTPVSQDYAGHILRAKLNRWTNYNGGIDWAIPSGSPIAAAQDGTVSTVRNDATGYGTHVRIQHTEGYLTIYGHLMDFNVRVGDKVKAGQVIGRSDNTGNSTGPHLHFELRKDGIAIDPVPLLDESVESISPDTEKELSPGIQAYIAAGWNLRAGPGLEYARLSSADVIIPSILLVSKDDWWQVRMDVWVHRDAIQVK
ncbi:M23 family metallopeptidase [Candidatus Parcubacteria bacterium]|jgi:hypothetical protein|nr:MAG: M23 family metallopeptidase [Candidatus Parcubacteria bacterium]